MIHVHKWAFDGGDPHTMQADRIWPMGRARSEDALLCPGNVASRVHAEEVTSRPIEPCEDEDLIAMLETFETFERLRFEDECSFGRAFVGLPWGRSEIGQGRCDPADRIHFKAPHGDL